MKTFIFNNSVVLQDINEYRVSDEFDFVTYKNDFYAKNSSDLYNIIYTVVNNGWNNFNFYCDDSYSSCLADVDELINKPYQLSYINNYVHPFNSYDRIHINYTSLGRIEVVVERLYTDAEIALLNAKVDELSLTLFKPDMALKDKIRAAHNYIIDHTKYDQARANAIINNIEPDNKYQSHKAIGPLIEGMGICGGYSDAMSLFLFELDVKQYRISNESHIWNYINFEDKWQHIDLTWDDPVVSTGDDILLTTYFMIDTAKLKDINDGKHYYDGNIFMEAQ